LFSNRVFWKLHKTKHELLPSWGHEVAPALSNHGAQRISMSLIQQGLGVLVSQIADKEPEKKKDLILKAYGVGTNVAAVLPISRAQKTRLT